MSRSGNHVWRQQNTRCSICGNSVSLETSKTDEQGSAVHEECYVGRTIALFARQRAERVRQIARPMFGEEILAPLFTFY